MNFWKKSKRPLNPAPHFWKIILQFFHFFLSFRPHKGWFINYIKIFLGPYSTETSITLFKTVIICPLPQSNDHQFDIPHLPPPPSPKIKIFSKLYMHEKKVLHGISWTTPNFSPQTFVTLINIAEFCITANQSYAVDQNCESLDSPAFKLTL